MKFSAVLLSLVGNALALPHILSNRQSIQSTTDTLLFSISLPDFIARRNARNPPSLDWESDNCTSSPDNPLGFRFTPACNRHDFGYHNYRNQNRFSAANKLNIDNNFKKDLYYQCSRESFAGICRALADVYYAAVRAFGGSDASKREVQDELVQEYEEKLAIYNKMVEEAKAAGLVSLGDVTA